MSTPKRFFINNLNYPESSEAVLEGEEFIHAKTVLRITEGNEIVLLGGDGNEYPAIVTKVENSRLSAHITGVNVGGREAKTPIYLLVGALKGDKTELVVQKATELGVAKVGVFSSRYCSAYMNENKLERLNKVAREAAKQCLRSVAPEVMYFDDFQSALQSAADYENRLFFCEFAHGSDVGLGGISGSTAVVVGSEGGFSDGEFALAKELGFSGMSLGKRILRA
ncbi:MAG: 16S rRNA (uracil(1498)-N(3))-methyltransferase, partial [Clostridia bacterium]|nr:16S rRNA (uracil(1498)-N(3))-methyltransferase [Clostridia bacterium]